MSEENTVKVQNRFDGGTGYVVPDLGGLTRTFQPGEIKDIPIDELKKLSWAPGGLEILKEYLAILDKKIANEILGETEPEYSYTLDDVKRILFEGSLDEFLDCLDFAPQGIIDIIKDFAVDNKLNDLAKRQAILDKTGFDVTNAIRINEESKDDDKIENTNAKERRVKKTEKNTTKERRVIKS